MISEISEPYEADASRHVVATPASRSTRSVAKSASLTRLRRPYPIGLNTTQNAATLKAVTMATVIKHSWRSISKNA